MTWNQCLTAREEEYAHLHPGISPQDFRHTLLISPKHHYVFANNPKVACTTIRKLLIDAEYGEIKPYAERSATLHYNEFLPFLDTWQVEKLPEWISRPDITTFCFVRNPFTRLLSGYLDKVVRNQPQKMNILKALGEEDQPESPITFATFVKAVCAMQPAEQDQHWRVQYYQTHQSGISYDFIGKFERLETDLRHIAEQLGIAEFLSPDHFSRAGQTSRHHATNAAEQLKEYYTPELVSLVRQHFAVDFEAFDYSLQLPE